MPSERVSLYSNTVREGVRLNSLCSCEITSVAAGQQQAVPRQHWLQLQADTVRQNSEGSKRLQLSVCRAPPGRSLLSPMVHAYRLSLIVQYFVAFPSSPLFYLFCS